MAAEEFAYDSRIDSNLRRAGGEEGATSSSNAGGRVVGVPPSGGLAALEKLARDDDDAKGCHVDRGGGHPREGEMAKWLEGVEEEELPFGEVAAEQLRVAPLLREEDCGDADCGDASCANDDGEGDADSSRAQNEPLAGPLQIREACDRLVASLPPSFGDDVRSDALALASLSVRLRPTTPWLTLRIEVAQFDACWRWHQDAYVSRTVVTYVGPGTCAVDDADVDWDAFERSAGEETNDECVSGDKIVQMQTNAVLIMKGNAWPGIRGEGLTHKAPGENEQDGDEPAKRLLLKVDLHNDRPPLGSEPLDDEEEGDGEGDDDDDDEEEEEEVEKEDEEEEEEEKKEDEEEDEEGEEVEGVGRASPRKLKRSAPSEGSKTSKAPKV